MSNNIYGWIITISITFLFQPGVAQSINSDAIQVKVLYEALEFDKAINRGQSLLTGDGKFDKDELITIHQFTALSFYHVGKIDSARSHFLSLLSIAPAFELDPIKISPKIIDFFNQLKEEIPDRGTDTPIGYTKYVFVEDLRPGATLRSMVLPGWGQIHKGQKKRGWIMGGAFLSSFAATGISLYLEKKNHDEYLDSSTPSAIEENYQTYDDWFKRRKFFTISTLSIWAVAVLDALWSPYPQATISAEDWGLSVSLNIPLRKLLNADKSSRR